MADLSSTAGTAALVAGGISILALLLTLGLAARVRRLRRDQVAVIGDGPPSDLVGYTRDLERAVGALGARVEELDAGVSATTQRLHGAIAHCAVIRYDAYNEISGRQSSSIALLDGHRNGVVLSSILHREQARLYAKRLTAGRSEIELSPEEQAAVDAALATD